MSGLRKISESKKRCNNPEHNPPMFISLEPGTYEYICPACGHRQVFTVPEITFKYREWGGC
jgi:hypothetical protein